MEVLDNSSYKKLLDSIPTYHILPAHPHHCAFCLLNIAECSVLPQLFHEIQPYGFDINGKYDCGPCVLSVNPVSFLVQKYSWQWGSLFKLCSSFPALLVEALWHWLALLSTVVPGHLRPGECQVSASRGEMGNRSQPYAAISALTLDGVASSTECWPDWLSDSPLGHTVNRDADPICLVRNQEL